MLGTGIRYEIATNSNSFNGGGSFERGIKLMTNPETFKECPFCLYEKSIKLVKHTISQCPECGIDIYPCLICDFLTEDDCNWKPQNNSCNGVRND